MKRHEKLDDHAFSFHNSFSFPERVGTRGTWYEVGDFRGF